MSTFSISRGFRTLGLAAALLGAGLSGSAFAAQGSELNNEPTAFAESNGPTVGPLAGRTPAQTRATAQGRAALNFLELSGATGSGGQPS